MIILRKMCCNVPEELFNEFHYITAHRTNFERGRINGAMLIALKTHVELFKLWSKYEEKYPHFYKKDLEE